MHSGSIRRVHHLNCATFKPWRGTTLVTHVLLLELEHGLALVDTGIGTADVRNPRRLGSSVKITGAAMRLAETALRQIEGMGFVGDDVTDIVATHLDYDHIGGLSDFPLARLHTTAEEFHTASRPTLSGGGLMRYRSAHTRPMLNVNTYGHNDTRVHGLGARSLRGLEEVFLVPMPGHTVGHAAVALIDPVRGWLVHAGDAFMHHSTLRPAGARTGGVGTRRLRLVERALAANPAAVATTHNDLRRLSNAGVRVFCSHDSSQFEALRSESHSDALLVGSGVGRYPSRIGTDTKGDGCD